MPPHGKKRSCASGKTARPRARENEGDQQKSARIGEARPSFGRLNWTAASSSKSIQVLPRFVLNEACCSTIRSEIT